MINQNILYAHEGFYGKDSNADANLIGEPITVGDKQYALFYVDRGPDRIPQVLAVAISEDYEAYDVYTEEEVKELGDGDFKRGVINVAREHIPRQ